MTTDAPIIGRNQCSLYALTWRAIDEGPHDANPSDDRSRAIAGQVLFRRLRGFRGKYGFNSRFYFLVRGAHSTHPWVHTAPTLSAHSTYPLLMQPTQMQPVGYGGSIAEAFCRA